MILIPKMGLSLDMNNCFFARNRTFVDWYEFVIAFCKRGNIMRVLELYQNGVIDYLYSKGLLSGSTLSYIQYYQRFMECRQNGKGYRESVRMLSKEFGVSETTIKKAVKIINN